jgi:hypothetical protein
MAGAPGGEAARQWARQAALREGAGTPKAVGLQRLRRPVQVGIRKEPAQNSAETHESTYVLPDPAAFEQAQDTIAQGLTEAVDNARAITTMKIILGDDADVLTELADDPELAERHPAAQPCHRQARSRECQVLLPRFSHTESSVRSASPAGQHEPTVQGTRLRRPRRRPAGGQGTRAACLP